MSKKSKKNKQSLRDLLSTPQGRKEVCEGMMIIFPYLSFHGVADEFAKRVLEIKKKNNRNT